MKCSIWDRLFNLIPDPVLDFIIRAFVWLAMLICFVVAIPFYVHRAWSDVSDYWSEL